MAGINIVLSSFLIIYTGQTLLRTLSSNPVKRNLYTYIKELGKKIHKQIDTQYVLHVRSFQSLMVDPYVTIRAQSLPRWRGLNHFNEIVNVKFSDSTKLQDIIRVFTFYLSSGN